MKISKYLIPITVVFSFSIFLNIGLTLAEENKGADETLSLNEEPELLWIWGEAVSVDPGKGEILVKYLDYEAGSEKEEVVKVIDKTTYENVKGLLDIKPQDTVSIDYSVAVDGANVAKNISVEKPRASQPTGNETYQEEIATQEEGKVTPEDIKKESAPTE